MTDPRTDFFSAGGDAAAQDARTSFFANETPSASAVKSEEKPERSFFEKALDYVPGLSAAAKFASTARAGELSAYELAKGSTAAEVEKRNRERIYAPAAGSPSAVVQGAFESNYNPLNWPSWLTRKIGEGITKGSDPQTWKARIDTSAGNPLLADKAGTVGYAPTPAPLPTTGGGSTIAGPVVEGVLNLGLSALPFAKGGMLETAPTWNRAPEIPSDIRAEPPLTLTDVPRTPSPAEATASATAAPTTAPPLTATSAPRAPMFEPTDIQRPFMDETKAAARAEAPSAQVTARAKVLQEIGLPQARTSALNNDGPAAMSEFQTSRDPTTPQGLEANRIFAQERQALTDYGNRIIQRTGGTAGTDGATLETRGDTILKPFDGLQEYFDAQRKASYAAADERAQGIATDLKGFQDVLKDESNLTNQDRVGLKTGLNAYLKKLGVLDDNGNITASVQQAETIRKYLNDEWSPQNSKFAGKLKDALDDDVAKEAGEDIYKQSRAIVKLQKDTLENPKGISDILDSSGPNGINRKVPMGQVADKIVNMPPAQLDHIMTTLREMPAELQPQAQGAIREIQSHFASRLSEVGNKFDGPWNHRGVNQFLDSHSARAPIIFGADNPLLKDMNTLRAGGNILRVDRSYPGAAIQGRILQSKLLPGAIATAGALGGEAVGSALGMPGIGTSVGGAAGGAAALKMSQRAATKAMQGRMTKLSDLLTPSGSSRGGPSP